MRPLSWSWCKYMAYLYRAQEQVRPLCCGPQPICTHLKRWGMRWYAGFRFLVTLLSWGRLRIRRKAEAEKMVAKFGVTRKETPMVVSLKLGQFLFGITRCRGVVSVIGGSFDVTGELDSLRHSRCGPWRGINMRRNSCTGKRRCIF